MTTSPTSLKGQPARAEGWGAHFAVDNLVDRHQVAVVQPRGLGGAAAEFARDLVVYGVLAAVPDMTVARPMSCVQGYSEVINPHTVGSLAIPAPSIKWV